MTYTKDEVRKLISQFVYRLDCVDMTQEEVQLFIAKWLDDADSIGDDDFERVHGILFETDNDVNAQDREDLNKLK